VALVNLSTGGALLEVPFQLRPGARLTVEMLAAAQRQDVSLRLLRCYVAELRHGVRYRAACEFEQALKLPSLPEAPSEPERLLQILEQFRHTSLSTDSGLHGTRFSDLLGWVVTASKQNEPAALISTRVEAHLRRLFPTLVICGKSPLPSPDPSTVSQFFDLEFRSSVPLTRADRHFLRACAQLISLLKKPESLAPAANIVHPSTLTSSIPPTEIAHTASEWIEMCGHDAPSR
jgi:hypothetical protein